MIKLNYIKSLFSPFKPFKLKWYCGKIALGTPYFFPRVWVKATPERAHKATLKYIKNTEDFNTRNPQYARKLKSYDEIFKDKMECSYAVPKKIGFDFVSLGWKTKFGEYRFEYSPLISFVFFKWQIAVTVIAPHLDHYWESWLYYEYRTDKNKSKQERVNQCRKEAPQIWTRYGNQIEGKVTTDYYDLILKDKYKN